MTDSIKHFTGFDITGKTEDEIRAAAVAMNIAVDETMGKGKLIDEIFGEKCEGQLYSTHLHYRLSQRNVSAL